MLDELRGPPGSAAPMNDGRLPFRVSASNVNCETTNASPPTAARSRFVLPSSSRKIRRPAILAARRLGVALGVVVTHADQQEVTESDRGHLDAVHRNGGPRHPLEHDAH